MSEHEFNCCICGKHIKGWGNNPQPVVMDDNAECCDECSTTVVLDARLKELENRAN